MSIAAASRVRNEMCYIQICVDVYDGGEIRGRLYNAYYTNAVMFDNWIELLRIMEAIFDKFNYPHATMEIRHFEDEDEKEVPKRPHIKCAPLAALKKHSVRGKLATFSTRVMFRQNASWQGFAKWLEEDIQENFSSTLEFMMLIDSVFTGGEIDITADTVSNR